MSSPGVSWDVVLKMAKIELELVKDPGMYIFFEKRTRDGICYISNRYSKANNKYLKSYDLKQKSKHIIYLDANNLYGHAMPKLLPTSGFKWIDSKELNLNEMPAIVQKYLYSKLIFNIQKNYANYIMIIL